MPYIDKEAEREAKRRWYQNNKEKHRASKKQVRKRLREWWQDYKRTLACTQCGENHPACLEFHHREDDKLFNVSDMISKGLGRGRILAEVTKCDVLCANCHRKEHAPFD